MRFAEQWECRECTWWNAFLRTKCRSCGHYRHHPDSEIDREIETEINANKAWDEALGIAPETRTDTL